MAFSDAQVLEVTQKAMAQAIAMGYKGESPNLTALNDTAIVDLGQTLQVGANGIFTVGSPADLFFRGLISVMSKIVTDTRAYVAKLPSLFVSTSEWGLISQFITVDLSEVTTPRST